MNIDSSTSSSWMLELDRQLKRGKCVLLHGNISDMFFLNNAPITLERFLTGYLSSRGYAIIAEYDPADGLRVTPEEAWSRFDRINSCDGDAGSTPSSAPTPGGGLMERARSVVPTPRPTARCPYDSVRFAEEARRLLGQTETPSALVWHYGERIVGDRERFDEKERSLVIRLDKLVRVVCQVIPAGALAGQHNALIMIAKRLGTVPECLYRDNPLVSLVHIQNPPSKDRRIAIARGIGRYYGAEEINSLDSKDSEQVLSNMVDLTDGMTLLDIAAICATSNHEKLPVTAPKELVDFYKFGLRTDPWRSLDQNRIATAEESILRQVYGQDRVVKRVCDMLVSAKVGIEWGKPRGGSGRPRGIFFFVGPTGVGKTELAKALTKLIFGDESAYARFDMSEYKESHSAQKLIGSPPGYVGYDEGGQLTNRVLKQPFSLLLFDEIEKAHPLVMDSFLQILDDGRLTDNKGQTAHFSQSVIVFTSNIGSQSLKDIFGSTVTDDDPPYKWVEEQYREAVKNHFSVVLGRPEIFSRLGSGILVFDVLRPIHVQAIMEKFLGMLRQSALELHGLDIDFSDSSFLQWLQTKMSDHGNYSGGGRQIRNLLDEGVRVPLNRWVFMNTPSRGSYRATLAGCEILCISRIQ